MGEGEKGDGFMYQYDVIVIGGECPAVLWQESCLVIR